ncbi:MAG: M23 family metallopeptidase [Formivibrio sp.]|nr:M23 family metallopeptidase [Formivibrio sp.]
MNIILVSSRLASAITFGPRQMAATLTLGLLLVGGGAFSLGMLLAPKLADAPLLRLLPGAAARQAEINGLAVKLGELQAKLLYLDGFAKRVGNKTGIEVAPFLSEQSVPRGGAAVPGHSLTLSSLLTQIATAEHQLGAYQDQLTLAEAILMTPNSDSLPVRHPVAETLAQSSTYGARIDPITGQQSFHEGIDYAAEIGTPVKAAGNGTVTFAAYHPEYGNMIDLDHGNGLLSRYAHNSKLEVHVGDKVSAGQEIALSGNSGRSTGAHLHFEIRYKNVPQNPLRFLTPDIVASKALAAAP